MSSATFSILLLASHMAGDYIFQSAHMAAHKLTDPGIRMWHVNVYTICFLPVTFAFMESQWQGAAFLALLWIAHFLTDSKRWRTTNPWPSMPMLQDQSLHIVQIALLSILLTWRAS